MKPGPSIIALFIALTAVAVSNASTENVTISPSNLNETVKFYSETAGELHTLTVQAASGYKFKTGPNLKLNPEDLWSKGGGDSFQLSDMEDRAEIEAEVDGVLVPDGSGGSGGSSQEYPFEITMITRYFTMEFIKPDEDTKVLPRNSEEILEIEVLNAIGKAATGEVAFSTSLGMVEPSGAAPISDGKVVANLITSLEGDVHGKINANATSVDISDEKTASGEKETEDIAIPKIMPADGQIGTNGDLVTSTKGDEEGEIHYVTPKSGGENVLFEAAFGNPGFSFSDELKWEGGSSAGPSPASQNVSRAAAQRKVLKLVRKSDNKEVDRMNVWCVWAGSSIRNMPNLYFDTRANVELLDGTSADEARIVVGPTSQSSDYWQIKFTVYPSEIFNVEEDVPDLRGEPDATLPGGMHPFSDRHLSQGANWKWDTSQRIRVRIINNAGLTQGKWPKSNPITNSPSLLSGQPITNSIILDFPSNPVEGNDDTYGNSNPYQAKTTDADWHGIGELVHTDRPGASISDWGMAQGDTFVERNDWQTFLRLNIRSKWYVISDYVPWFIELKVEYDNNHLVNDGSNRGSSSL